MNLGFRVMKREKNTDIKQADMFQPFPVANIADNMNRMFCMEAEINLMNTQELKMTGIAVTVKVRPGDNLMFHKALDMAGDGDVMVVDAGGDCTNSIMGELMCYYAIKRNIRGIIIDGCIRDFDAIRTLAFPVYARGVIPSGPYKDGPGEVNTTISCGGVTVNPGDIIVGDVDGIVVIPPEHASEIIEKTKKKYDDEQIAMKQIENGEWDRSWINETLKAKGVEVNE